MIDNNRKDNIYLPSEYKFIKRKIICSNSKFDILFDHVISPDNQEIEDFLIVKPKIRSENNIIGICVLPMLDGHFYLMRGWRHQFKELIYQAPAGFIEKGESPFQSALRELREETSLICKPENLISLGSFIPDAGLIEGNVSLFLAKECIRSSLKVESEIGSSKIIKFSQKEIKDLIQKESNIGGSTLVVCMRSLIYLLEK